MFGSIGNFALLAVPFFIFAGELMARGGMARRLVAVVMALFGGFRGSTPITTVGAATLYGAISGSTAATVAALGPMFYPQLRKAGYSEKFSVGIITCTGFIDNIIPPSIAMILFCAAAEELVIKLFAAGIMPGLMLAGLMSVYLYFYARCRRHPRHAAVPLGCILHGLEGGLLAIGAPVLIFGGLYGGIFSPTEAAGAACVYIAFVTMFIYREIGWRDLWDVSINSMYLTAQIFLIVAVAGVFSWLFITSGVPRAAVAFIEHIQLQPWMVLLVINIFLLIVGCFIDTASAILVLTPLLAADCAWRSASTRSTSASSSRSISASARSRRRSASTFSSRSRSSRFRLTSIYAGVVPFIGVTVLGLMIITYWPGLSLWLVKYIG